MRFGGDSLNARLEMLSSVAAKPVSSDIDDNEYVLPGPSGKLQSNLVPKLILIYGEYPMEGVNTRVLDARQVVSMYTTLRGSLELVKLPYKISAVLSLIVTGSVKVNWI